MMAGNRSKGQGKEIVARTMIGLCLENAGNLRWSVFSSLECM